MRHIQLVLLTLLVLGSGVTLAGPPGTIEGVRFSCPMLGGLQNTLNKVNNEQQVYNVNTGSDVVTNDSGCQIQFPGVHFLYTPEEACEAGIWGCIKVGFKGWIKTEKFWVRAWVVGHPRETVVVRGSGRNLGDRVQWTAGEMYRRSDAELHRDCLRRTYEVEGVTLYGHQFSYGNELDSEDAYFCANPPIVKSNHDVLLPGGEEDTTRRLTLEQEKALLLLKKLYR